MARVNRLGLWGLWVGAFISCSICLLAASTSTGATTAIPAFPGAEGFGAGATGGRGGRVIEVTTLADSGPGSLREAATAAGPRIVVFRVAGTIALAKTLKIASNVTIAGQTAPGDGVCLRNYNVDISGAENVIVRHLRFRLGDTRDVESDSLTSRYGRRIIIDHCSASWSVDECVSLYENNEVTVQWCLISESLYHSVHGKGNHGYGGIWGGQNGTFHHNLLAHHSSRNPRVGSQQQNVDLRNNVIYNWGFNSLYGGENSTVNVIACYYKPGPATNSGVRSRILDGAGVGGRWYLTDNVVEGDAQVTADNWAGGVHRPWASQEVMRATVPFPAPQVKTQTAGEAYLMVLACSGAILPKRDSLDTRIVEETRTGTAQFGGAWGEHKGIIDSQETVGGWPELASTAPPADSDHDGMPDTWETEHSLDPNSSLDSPADLDHDGYTNVEEYLNTTDPNQFVDYTDPNNNIDPVNSAAWKAASENAGTSQDRGGKR